LNSARHYAQGQIFIYLKGGVEKFLVGCKRHHSWASTGVRHLGWRLSHKIGGVKWNFGGVEHFIRGVRKILGGFNPPSNGIMQNHGIMQNTGGENFGLKFIQIPFTAGNALTRGIQNGWC
jgi:hypothetical protein